MIGWCARGARRRQTPSGRFWHDAGMAPLPEPSSDCVTVLYDGACPLCRREIGLYRNLQPLQPVAWHDVSAVDAVLPDSAERTAYMARFHVRLADGKLVSGAAAFVALWSVLPGWRWLGRLGRMPGMLAVMETLYRLFLRIRPSMQRIARWLESRLS